MRKWLDGRVVMQRPAKPCTPVRFRLQPPKIMFSNKNILITGGTGSFGKQFTKFILNNYKPNKLIIFSRDEYKQFLMKNELQSDRLRFFIGDVRDKERVDRALNGVDYVVHAAAMKQVEASEYNPTECIKTNISGAQNIIDSSIKNNVKKVIALSTDKAASPLNLYGATKLVSDKLFVAANNLVGHDNTSFSVVRYGNVVGSRGSVIPFFKKLLDQGEKILPITHEDMTRFCITLDQGVEFVVKSFLRMWGGEIFVPKLPSMKMTDLAKLMSGNDNYNLIGIRPGEKIHEIMIPEDEARLTVEFDDFFTIKPSIELFRDESIYHETQIKEKLLNNSIDYEYSSGTNDNFLSYDQIKAFL